MADGREHARVTVAVLNVGGVDPCCKQQTARVGEDMTLAALDLLTRVKAPWAAAFRGLHALAVDDPGRRAGLAPLGLARRHKQTVIDTRLQLVIPPHREMALHRRTWREILRQQSPEAAAAQDIEDGIHDIESEARKERGRRSLDKREQQKHKEQQKAKRALQRQEFACHEDAVRAVEKFKKQLTSERLSSFSVHEKRRYSRRGRLAKDTPFVLTYRVELELVENEQALSRAQRRAGRSILATNELSESRLLDALVLTLYKGRLGRPRAVVFDAQFSTRLALRSLRFMGIPFVGRCRTDLWVVHRKQRKVKGLARQFPPGRARYYRVSASTRSESGWSWRRSAALARF